MFKRFLSSVFLITSVFNSFAIVEPAQGSLYRSDLSLLILFINKGDIYDHSIELACLMHQRDLNDEQLKLVSDLFIQLGDKCKKNTEAGRNKFRELEKLYNEAKELYQNSLFSLYNFDKKIKNVTSIIAQKMGAAMVLSNVRLQYLNPKNNITVLVIDFLNSEYRNQAVKVEYPICDFAPFIQKMNEVMSVDLSVGA